MFMPLALGMPGPMELSIILVIVLVIFGGSRVAGLGKSLGEGISEFKRAVKGEDEEEKGANDAASTDANANPSQQNN